MSDRAGSTGTRWHSRPLDGLRGIAIAAVMLEHTNVAIGSFGYLGVDVFFVLSGYLITTLLMRERERLGRVDLPRFYLRRALRLYPALVMTVVVFAPFARYVAANHTTAGYAEAALLSLTYVQNIAVTLGHNAGLGHTWSLAMEEQFYLLWPVTLLALTRLGHRRAAMVTAGIGLLSMAAYAMFLRPVPGGLPIVYFNPLTRAGPLMMGCALALWLSSAPVTSRRIVRALSTGGVVGLAGLAVFADVALNQHWEALDIPLAALSTCALITGVTGGQVSVVSRVLAARPLVGLGTISYALYLVHVPVYAILGSHWTGARHDLIAVEMLVSIAIASLSYVTVERYFRRLRPIAAPRRDVHVEKRLVPA
jgi:peptidoglycan/LPS O-acetylase OafA/YrhL